MANIKNIIIRENNKTVLNTIRFIFSYTKKNIWHNNFHKKKYIQNLKSTQNWVNKKLKKQQTFLCKFKRKKKQPDKKLRYYYPYLEKKKKLYMFINNDYWSFCNFTKFKKSLHKVNVTRQYNKICERNSDIIKLFFKK